MTIKHYHFSIFEKESREANEDKAKQVAAEFKVEFAAMMRKYKAEICVRESSHGYEGPYAEGFDVDFDGIYEDGETVRPYFTVEFGMNETAESIEV